ncbi:MAG: Imm30 family immunity protein [Pseudomonadota bacterium]
MTTDIEETLSQLGTLDAGAPDFVPRFEAGLAEVVPRLDGAMMPRLLTLFADDRPDAAMFSLIHTVEKLDRATYLSGLADGMSSLVRVAPRWASIIVMRVLNDPDYVQAFGTELRDRDAETKEAVTWLMNAINARSSSFKEKTQPLLDAMQ